MVSFLAMKTAKHKKHIHTVDIVTRGLILKLMLLEIRYVSNSSVVRLLWYLYAAPLQELVQPETNSLPLKIGRAPKRKRSVSSIQFLGANW